MKRRPSPPSGGDRLDPHTLSAIKNKKLLPIAELDRGFVRPTYPEQVVVSYFRRAAFAATSRNAGAMTNCLP